MTRPEFTAWIQEAFLQAPGAAGPDYLGNLDDRLLIFIFPDGSRFGLAVLDETELGKARDQIAQGSWPVVRVIDEDLEADEREGTSGYSTA